ncbi:MAG TPA: NAD-dependent epimerase/dehydratase family protein [Bacteroidota bacterium]|nr:NAD-dependent epimerase/dehydratase family protein [Bacteroidota bacterium]
MSIKAIVFGATGMVGEGVLHVALNHPDVESVLVVGRRSCGVSHPKLLEVVHGDFFNYTPIESRLAGYNACYFCLGVSSIGMNERDYTRVTHDLTLEAARSLSRLNPDMTFCYVSGAGTDGTEKGKSMWARVKGKTENDLLKVPFRAVYNFRPGFIRPIKGLKNAFTIARILGAAYPVLDLLFPNHVCTLDDLGHAMLNVTKTGYSSHVLECADIAKLGAITRSPPQ